MLIKIRFQTTVTVLISFVLTRWIMNEFEKENGSIPATRKQWDTPKFANLL